jgi:hypothetical protein
MTYTPGVFESIGLMELLIIVAFVVVLILALMRRGRAR